MAFKDYLCICLPKSLYDHDTLTVTVVHVEVLKSRCVINIYFPGLTLKYADFIENFLRTFEEEC